MEGYYVYLPAVMIHGGFDGFKVRDTAYIRNWPGTNKVFTKYTYGVALLESPFFISAHLLSRPLGYASNGYSAIYAYALILAGLFYMLFGMCLLWNILIPYFKPFILFLSLAGLFLGTNLYYYTFFQPLMSHVYSFFLFAALIWATEKLSSGTGTLKEFYYWIAMGFICSLIVLIRPTNIIVLAYPLYRFIKDHYFTTLTLRKSIGYISIAALCAGIIWLPQFLYWKTVTGQFFMWSYGEESFTYWRNPKIIRVLIDPWNGWLLYSPMVIFPIIGLFLQNRYYPYYNKIVGILLLCATYIFSSWWAWWFGGAFGHRSFVEFYAFLAVPFAQWISLALKYKWSSAIFLFFFLTFAYYNIGLTYQYSPPWDGSNWNYESVLNEIKKLL